ncbi:unnamed protein product [Coregonus sp. 'balchen']|nr:unnamed protein product [Coregonus sp. 'balchen']
MNQYYQVLSSCRVPGLKRDTVFFVLDLYNSDSTPMTVDQLYMQLEKISNSSLQTNKEPIGILTSNQCNTRVKAYNNLIKDKTNKDLVRAIQKSIFTVHLLGAPMPCVSDELKKSEMVGTQMVPLPMPQKLCFNITPEIKKDIEKAKAKQNAIRGQAIDRYLLRLKLQAIEDLTSMPEIFMDTSYAVRLTAMACATTPWQNINFAVSAFNSCDETNAEEALLDTWRLLERTPSCERQDWVKLDIV